MKLNNEPSDPLGDGDRGADGKFRPGNRAGKGNPLGGRVARLRSALIQAIDEKDIEKIVKGLIEAAKSGDVAAAKLVFAYVLGQPLQADIIERIENLEAVVADRGRR